MKAEELMRFDWVHLADDSIPRQVDWIKSGEVGLFWNKTVTPPYLEPIPLTPEILENNGFFIDTYQDGYEKFWVRGDFVFGINGFTSVGRNNFKIEYVHQLQHALRLCGIDKTIEL